MINYDDNRSLITDVWYLFNQAVTYRNTIGITRSLQVKHVHDNYEHLDYAEHSRPSRKSGDCQCRSDNCETCNPELQEICSISEIVDFCKSSSVFSKLSELLITVKQNEYVALYENVYAPMGNKPFSLKPIGESVPTAEEIEEGARIFYESLETFLAVNQVRVNEIPQAFNFNTLSELTEALSDTVQREADSRATKNLQRNEKAIEKDFNMIKTMDKYQEMLRDTCDYPIAGLWCDSAVIRKRKVIKRDKLTWEYNISPDVERIDPNYLWLTPDYRATKRGRAVFKLIQLTDGDIRRLKTFGTTGSDKINSMIEDFLYEYNNGSKIYQASLFKDYWTIEENTHDVLVSRGDYAKESLEDLGVTIPELYADETYVPCEIYFTSQHILKCEVLQCDENLGVYLTRFRRNGDCVFGFSLRDYVYPFAKLYEGTVKAIDTSVGKSVNSIIQIDTAVIEDSERVLSRNKDGQVELDLTGDIIVEFDSSETYQSPNFKGIPLHVDQLPSHVEKLLPILNMIFTQLEEITGIPQILVNANNISSALRTDGSFNAAYNSSAKVIKSLLRDSEKYALTPMVMFFFEAKASNGDFKGYLTEFEPQVLTSDTLNTENNNDRRLVNDFDEIVRLQGIVPQETITSLVNTLGREVYNLQDDLIPGAGVLNTSPQPQPQNV